MDGWKIATIVTAGLSAAYAAILPGLAEAGASLPAWIGSVIAALGMIFASNTGTKK